MREIKFRAWDPDAAEMIYSDREYPEHFFEFVHYKLKCVGVDPDGFPGDQWAPPGPASYIIDEIMQFTGLLDKNGNGVYENDIVTGTVSMITGIDYAGNEATEDFPFKSEVKFEDGSFMVKVQPWESWICFDTLKEYEIELEIIGNRFENPELLEE